MEHAKVGDQSLSPSLENVVFSSSPSQVLYNLQVSGTMADGIYSLLLILKNVQCFGNLIIYFIYKFTFLMGDGQESVIAPCLRGSQEIGHKMTYKKEIETLITLMILFAQITHRTLTVLCCNLQQNHYR